MKTYQVDRNTTFKTKISVLPPNVQMCYCRVIVCSEAGASDRERIQYPCTVPCCRRTKNRLFLLKIRPLTRRDAESAQCLQLAVVEFLDKHVSQIQHVLELQSIMFAFIVFRQLEQT